MARSGLPIPLHFRPDQTDRIFRVPYQERAIQAADWAERHALKPAADDKFRVVLLAVDVQNTFCIPGFELFVGGRSGRGAVDDSRRLCEFLYRNLGVITQVIATLDTHQAMQIFHAIYLVNSRGEHPPSFTQVSADDIESGKWNLNPEVAQSLDIDVDEGRRYLLHYARELERTGKYELSIWPYHSMLGGIGHALVSAFEEAVFFHTIARRSQADLRIKGHLPETEHYSALGPEVTTDFRGRQFATRDRALIDKLWTFDVVIIAGQAKSHCVAWTIEDLLKVGLEQGRNPAGRIYLLEDCTSPVVVPGVVDYTENARAAYTRFAETGMHVVRSTDPIEGWPR
jgi:nicotinamidase-related amidase